jgi:rod shape-determining protein MreC
MASSNRSGIEIARSRVSAILSALASPFGIIPAIIHLASENTRLRAENAEYLVKSSEAQEAIQENERLRQLLGFKNRSHLNLKAVEVITTDPLPGVHSLLIDAGSAQGAAKHQAVINDKGLVGKLVQVSEQNSIVQVLLDRNLGVAVRMTNCRANGFTRWAGLNRLLLENIPASAPVRIGEEVVCSGLDGIFPEGIPVGRVVYSEKREGSLFLLVEVEPYVNFSRLEEVFLVLSDTASL